MTVQQYILNAQWDVKNRLGECANDTQFAALVLGLPDQLQFKIGDDLVPFPTNILLVVTGNVIHEPELGVLHQDGVLAVQRPGTELKTVEQLKQLCLGSAVSITWPEVLQLCFLCHYLECVCILEAISRYMYEDWKITTHQALEILAYPAFHQTLGDGLLRRIAAVCSWANDGYIRRVMPALAVTQADEALMKLADNANDRPGYERVRLQPNYAHWPPHKSITSAEFDGTHWWYTATVSKCCQPGYIHDWPVDLTRGWPSDAVCQSCFFDSGCVAFELNSPNFAKFVKVVDLRVVTDENETLILHPVAAKLEADDIGRDVLSIRGTGNSRLLPACLEDSIVEVHCVFKYGLRQRRLTFATPLPEHGEFWD